MRILVTPRSMTRTPPAELPELAPLVERGWEIVSGPAGKLPTEDELCDLVGDVDGWIAGVEQITARVFDQAPKLRVISRNGVGADAVDTDAARVHGIEIVLARGANSQGVAELAVAHILNGLRDITGANAVLHDGGWERRLGREVPDLRIGVLGFGAIGRIVAGTLAAMGADVVAHDPFVPVEGIPGVRSGTAEDVFAGTDVVSLHIPPAADGTPAVGAAQIAAMRPDGILVNTARAALVDHDAALAALEDGTLVVYAVDAFDQEPPELTPLLQHPRTVMTPHLGGYTAASTRRASELAVLNLVTSLGD